MSLNDVLAGARNNTCLEAIAARYHVPVATVGACLEKFRPVMMRQIAAALTTATGAERLLRALADPSLNTLEQNPMAICEHPVRLAGDAHHRLLSHYDDNAWTVLDTIARDVDLSHQTLRAMAPLLTMILLSALRQATAPAFLRLLQRERPDDTSTDPFAFAVEHADTLSGRQTRPETALRWLDVVLARAQTDGEHVSIYPDERIA